MRRIATTWSGASGPGYRVARPGIVRVLALAIALTAALAGVAPVLTAQEAGAEDRFAAESLRHRTTLHYDPLLDAPLESLVKLYVGADRADELIALYRTHIEQYPEDAGAKTVLIRVLRRVKREEADEAVNAMVPLHPDYAPLQFTLFRFLEERGDPRATEALSRAIDLEKNPTRRNDWLDQLLRLSEGEAARVLAEGHFQKRLAPPDLPLDELLGLARLMQRYRFWETSITTLTRARGAKPDPETEVEILLMLATALNQTGKKSEAAALLDQLLVRLAADHWRRREILSLRLEAVASGDERAAYLDKLEKAHSANPGSEAAALDYAGALVAVERRDDAIAVVTAALTRLSKSALLESRALEWLEGGADSEAYARFLAERLEADPARLDLRFRLVKVQYSLGRDAAAEQDFRTVVAGLEPAEASARILELQRYLRGIERLDAAASYLERYVRNHPTRLDVARELAEVRIAAGQGATIGELVRWLQPEEAEVENVLDFATFLLESQFAHAARHLVEAKLAREPRQFDLGLLLIEILGRAGDANAAGAHIAAFRELADTAPRYAQWLEASVAAHRALETLPGFFDTELNRYQFDDGAWSAEKVDRFLILCELGKRQFLTTRVAAGLRQQLAQSGLDPALRMRLRKVLVAVLEADPAAAPEAEEQLRLLTEEDPAARAGYDLRRVLVYHRSQRVDLAQALVLAVDFTEVDDPGLLREVTDLLIEYGFLREADLALAVINRLEPGDLLSWERRLSVLVTLGNESTLRALLRTLRTGEAGVVLRELSNRSLDEHLDASYWRSIAALLREGTTRYGEILPLLASAEREVITASSGLWSEWTRAHVLTRLGQAGEAAEAMARFHARADERSLERVRFPDGLELSVDAAAAALGTVSAGAGEGEDRAADFLLAQPVMQWAFELPEGARIVKIGRGGGSLLVLDDLDQVSALDAATGKLLWRAAYPRPGEKRRHPVPAAFQEVAAPPALLRKPGKRLDTAALPRDFAVAGDRFFLLRGRTLTAGAVSDGTTLWTAALPAARSDRSGPERSRQDLRFAVGEGVVVALSIGTNEIQAYDTTTGKLLWQLALGPVGSAETSAGAFHSLNTGVGIQGGRAFVYGHGAAIVDLASGRPIWTLGGDPASLFPLVLRPDREEEPVAVASTEPPAGDIGTAPRPTLATFGELTRFDFQATAGGGQLEPRVFLGGDATLLSPAQYWVQSRGEQGGPAFGMLSPGNLWLMQDGKVRRISSDLPVASRELSMTGTWIGRAGNHLWFLEGSILNHADFGRERVSRLSLHDLGDPAFLRATVVGNQVIVRGAAAIRVINALSGEVLGQATFPTTLLDYLGAFPEEFTPGAANPAGGDFAWQGRFYRNETTAAGIALPVGDLVEGLQYHTVFGRRLVVSLGRADDDSDPPPPAPGAPGGAPAVAPTPR